jgi:ribonuclease HII
MEGSMPMSSKLTKNEKMLVEAINSMFDLDAQVGLAFHDKKDLEPHNEERGYEYLHNQIDDMFALKAAELIHADSVNQAFHKVHSYKYLDDPTFPTAMEKELVAQAVPAEERAKAVAAISSIIKELRKEQKNWAEKDYGFNPHMDEIEKVSKPEQPLDFKIHDKDGYNEANVDWDKEDFKPGRTPDA